jgi:hypothetical protein
MIHELVRKERIIADHIDLVTLGGMDHVIDSNVFLKQAAMCKVVTVLPSKEKTTASLGIKVPKQNA